MRVVLNREEILACIIALQKEKPYGWRDDVLRKLDKKMGFKLVQHQGRKGDEIRR